MSKRSDERKAQSGEVTADVRMRHDTGLNARTARALCELVRRFDCEASIRCADGRTASAADLLGLLMLGVRPAERLTLLCRGPQAREAREAIVKLLET